MKSYRKDRERCLEKCLQFICGCKVLQAQDTVINKADSSTEPDRKARKKQVKQNIHLVSNITRSGAVSYLCLKLKG